MPAKQREIYISIIYLIISDNYKSYYLSQTDRFLLLSCWLQSEASGSRIKGCKRYVFNIHRPDPSFHSDGEQPQAQLGDGLVQVYHPHPEKNQDEAATHCF